MKKIKKNNQKPNVIKNIYDLTIVLEDTQIFGVDRLPICIITRSVGKQIINSIKSIIRLNKWKNMLNDEEALHKCFETLYEKMDKSEHILEEYINAFHVFELASDYSNSRKKYSDTVKIQNIKAQLFNRENPPKVYIGDDDKVRYKIFRKKKFKEGYNTVNTYMCIDKFTLGLMNDICNVMKKNDSSIGTFSIRDISSFYYLDFILNNKK